MGKEYIMAARAFSYSTWGDSYTLCFEPVMGCLQVIYPETNMI